MDCVSVWLRPFVTVPESAIQTEMEDNFLMQPNYALRQPSLWYTIQSVSMRSIKNYDTLKK
jgi:hypothetical protein